MRGLTQDVEIQGQAAVCSGAATAAPLSPPTTVIGVICAGDLAVSRDTVKQALKRGIEQHGGNSVPSREGSSSLPRPEAVWVCIEPKSDRLTHDLMISLGIEPVVLPMLDAWRHKNSGEDSGPQGALTSDKPSVTGSPEYDFRRVWRDLEMLQLCDEMVVFHKRAGQSPWRDRAASGLYTDKLVIVELGKPKPKSK